MTDRDRLLILTLENVDSVRLQKLLRHTEQTGRSISEVIAAGVRQHLDGLNWEERRETVEQFVEETGIDLEELL
jgi:hypothetical protein